MSSPKRAPFHAGAMPTRNEIGNEMTTETPTMREYHNAVQMRASELRHSDSIKMPEGVYKVLGARAYQTAFVGPVLHIQVTTVYGINVGGFVRLPWERVDVVQWTRDGDGDKRG